MITGKQLRLLLFIGIIILTLIAIFTAKEVTTKETVHNEDSIRINGKIDSVMRELEGK